jgi:hypothetical protein
MGIYYWLIQDQKRALKWWQNAIEEGGRLGAHPQLARTYAEMGIRLSTNTGSNSGVDIVKAKQYLCTAKKKFSELGLHQELDDLNPILHQIEPEP